MAVVLNENRLSLVVYDFSSRGHPFLTVVPDSYNICRGACAGFLLLRHHREVQRPRRQKNINRTQKNTRNKRPADLCKMKINKTSCTPLGVGGTQVYLQGASSEDETRMLWPRGEVHLWILGNLGILLISTFLHLSLSPFHNFFTYLRGVVTSISTRCTSISIRFAPCASLGGFSDALCVCVSWTPATMHCASFLCGLVFSVTCFLTSFVKLGAREDVALSRRH
jgi:hypothetical protein